MAKFAADTSVSSDRSRAEIENTLRRYGADRFAYMSERTRAVIGFEVNGRRIRFDVPMPDPTAKEFHWSNHATPQKRTPTKAHEAWEQACRQKWRALALVVKAKLEAVESGVAEFQDEFLAYIVLPNGQTVGDMAAPSIEAAYAGKDMPPLLGKF